MYPVRPYCLAILHPYKSNNLLKNMHLVEKNLIKWAKFGQNDYICTE